MARNTQLNGLTFTAAQCDEPASTKAGTEYTCTAMGSDGQQRTLTVKIVGPQHAAGDRSPAPGAGERWRRRRPRRPRRRTATTVAPTAGG